MKNKNEIEKKIKKCALSNNLKLNLKLKLHVTFSTFIFVQMIKIIFQMNEKICFVNLF